MADAIECDVEIAGLIITSGHRTFVRSISFIDRSFVAVTEHMS